MKNYEIAVSVAESYNRGLSVLNKGLERIANNGNGFVHFGFRDSAKDYVYANYKDGKITVDTKHPWNYGCVLHLKSSNPKEDMLFIAECLATDLTNEAVLESWLESGREYR